MERLKGLLKRRSAEIRVTANDFSEMEVVSDPENTAEIHANRVNNTVNTDNPNNMNGNDDDDTYPLMMDKIETLTMEKYSLEDRLSTVTSELEARTRENLDLKSKCDDLLKSLELEKRRFRWQQKYYESQYQQLAGGILPTSSSTNSMDTADNNNSSSGSRNSETEQNRLRCSQSMEDILGSSAFYEDTIQALVIVQEEQRTEMRNMRESHEDELKRLSLEHEQQVSEILEAQQDQVQKMIGENEGLIRDLLTGCEGLFDDLKSEFTVEASHNSELKTKSGTNILVQFHELSPLVKGIAIAGITVISVATAGWASWGFIIWVWPRLIAFAEVLAANPETFAYLFAFLNSVPFSNFVRSWEDGKSLGECLKAFANTEFLSSALRMAPDLFTQFKKFPRPIAN